MSPLYRYDNHGRRHHLEPRRQVPGWAQALGLFLTLYVALYIASTVVGAR